MVCPNCSRDALHHRWQGGQRCCFCQYDTNAPSVMPKIPEPLKRICCSRCASNKIKRYPTYDIPGKVIWMEHCQSCGVKYDPAAREEDRQQGYKSKAE